MNSHHVAPERFHALDATRAFALMLGVVFHASWSFVSTYSNAPATDVSGNLFFDWFFETSHTFRMQLFFLIAGFFGAMVMQRAGWQGFANQRFRRIALPMLVFWFLIIPVFITPWIWGNIKAGTLELPVSLPLFSIYIVISGLIFVQLDHGGFFVLTHLWFLYYLTWFCLFSVVIVQVTKMLSGIRYFSCLPEKGRSFVKFCCLSKSGLVLIVIFTGCLMTLTEGWTGVDTPAKSLALSLGPVLVYGSFFLFGWLLYGQTSNLEQLKNHWKTKIIFGFILSLGLFGTHHHLNGNYGIGGFGIDYYPRITMHQIKDWEGFHQVISSGFSAEASGEMKNFWDHLSAQSKKILTNVVPDSSIHAQASAVKEISKSLSIDGLFDPIAAPAEGEDPQVTFTDEGGVMKNRRRLEELMQGSLRGSPYEISWYWPAKFGYSILYASVTWLFVFGTIGFFQDKFSGHRQWVRYIADSSYWIYIAHMPMVPLFQVWISDWSYPGIIKFTVLNVVSFFILFASYHYLVRSTFIGKFLNGKKYPFKPFPWS